MSKIIYIDNEPVLWPYDTITGEQLQKLAAEVIEKRLPGCPGPDDPSNVQGER